MHPVLQGLVGLLATSKEPTEEWIETLARIQTACSDHETKAGVLDGLHKLLFIYPPETIRTGKVLLLLLGSVTPEGVTSPEFLSRFGEDRETLAVLLAAAGGRSREMNPSIENIEYWQNCFRGSAIGWILSPTLRAEGYVEIVHGPRRTLLLTKEGPILTDITGPCVRKLLDGRHFPNPVFENGLGELEGDVRKLALKAWKDGRIDLVSCFERLLGFSEGSPSPDAEQVAIDVLRDRNAETLAREYAFQALGKAGSPEAMEAIKVGLDTETSPERRARMIEVLHRTDDPAFGYLLDRELHEMPKVNPARLRLLQMLPKDSPRFLDEFRNGPPEYRAKIIFGDGSGYGPMLYASPDVRAQLREAACADPSFEVRRAMVSHASLCGDPACQEAGRKLMEDPELRMSDDSKRNPRP